ncbi:protein phosphatase 2C domain-containing protein [Streptosporangium sp. NPDC006013]|uniref:protein phosphatase 2C domain-containing protein n=1 Tax=Streptosporangium sp. NPDC006013 TaxID=3155596 RepID=UPI0033BC8316
MEQSHGSARPELPEPVQALPEPSTPVPTFPEPLVIGRPPMLRSDPGVLPTPHPEHLGRPDSELDGAALPGLVVRAASIRGDAHRYYGTPRQDAMGLWQTGEAQLLTCVADGLGSKELSHAGASQACASAYRNITDLRAYTDLQVAAEYLIEGIADDIRKQAVQHEVPADALSTTFLAAVIDQSADASSHRARLMRVGDSTAFLLRRGVWEECFGKEGEETIASSATHALPGDIGHVEVAVADLEPGDMLLLCTDGISTPLTRNSRVGDQLSAWWSQAEPPSLPEFFWQSSFRAKSYDDDRTAICVWRV